MAVRHIKAYFEEVAQQYHDMLEEIRDFEKEAEKGLIEPERLDTIKESIQPLMNNYQMISYIMFLLNKPNRARKEKDYIRRNKKLLATIKHENTKQGIMEQNQEVIKNLQNITKTV